MLIVLRGVGRPAPTVVFDDDCPSPQNASSNSRKDAAPVTHCCACARRHVGVHAPGVCVARHGSVSKPASIISLSATRAARGDSGGPLQAQRPSSSLLLREAAWRCVRARNGLWHQCGPPPVAGGGCSQPIACRVRHSGCATRRRRCGALHLLQKMQHRRLATHPFGGRRPRDTAAARQTRRPYTGFRSRTSLRRSSPSSSASSSRASPPRRPSPRTSARTRSTLSRWS